MIARVTVVCDNAKHAGKVAKVSTFYVEAGQVVLRDNGRDRRNRRYERFISNPASEKAKRFVARGITDTPACNLCGRALPDDPRVNRAVVRLATQPEQNASLSDIAASIQLEA